RLLAELFKEVPTPQSYPAYYKLVKHPIDMESVCAKVTRRRYPDLTGIEKDIRLMLCNVQKLN
ncbi:unnamed protein product, partial [Discosporangium mesarthrocarpum]